MLFQSRVFQLAKDPENPEQYEDAWRLDARRGIAAIADGVSASIFSGLWAEILTTAVVDAPPDPSGRAALAAWLTPLRQAWAESIDATRLTWFQKAKLKLGAFSTLLWASLEPRKNQGQPGEYRLRSFAIGDSCLFLLRDGRLLRSFPIQDVAEFKANPLVIGSLDLGRDDRLVFGALDETCREGDLLVLCTDAVAAWSLQRLQSGLPAPWEDFWPLSDEAWQQEVVALRAREELRYDDATLLLLRVTADTAAAAEPIEPSDYSETGTAGQAGSGTPQIPPQPAEDIYPLAPEPAARPGPPLLPPGAPPRLGEPPPLPDWAQAVNEAAEQISHQVGEVTGQVLRGMRDLKAAALRKYREKFPPRDP